MNEFKELSELERKKYEAQEVLDKLKVVRVKIETKEEALLELKEIENNIEKDFYSILHIYYKCKLNVKENDIIESNGVEYRFVGFHRNSKDPIVNYKLKNNTWSKKRVALHLYDWKSKNTL